MNLKGLYSVLNEKQTSHGADRENSSSGGFFSQFEGLSLVFFTIVPGLPLSKKSPSSPSFSHFGVWDGNEFVRQMTYCLKPETFCLLYVSETKVAVHSFCTWSWAHGLCVIVDMGM